MKKNLGKIITGVAILLGIVAFFMMFAPAAVSSKGFDGSLSGKDLAFGYKEKGVKLLGASANILTYILLVVGIVCAVVALCGKGGKIVPVIATVAFVVAGLMFFLNIQLCMPYPELESSELKKEMVKATKESLALGAGAIVGGIFSILAGAAALVPVFVKSK